MEPEVALSSILNEYDASRPLNEDFRLTCERLIRELLNVEGIRVHSVTSRVKAREKLREKCGRDGKNYRRLADVTDIVGIRVITHLADEVDRIGTIIEREFLIVGPGRSTSGNFWIPIGSGTCPYITFAA